VTDEAKPARAPINEVVFATRFDAPEFSVVHFGRFYDRIREQYPINSVQPGIARPTGPEGGNMVFDVSAVPRLWFESDDGRLLVQLQQDRFIFNWRRRADDDRYPGFDALFAEWQRLWGAFMGLLAEVTTVKPKLEELALTYIDQIADLDTLTTPIFIFREKEWRKDFPEPEIWSTQFRFAFPAENLKLAVNARPSIRMTTQKPFTNFEMTIGAIETQAMDNEETVRAFFAAAHDKVHWAWNKLVRPEWLRAWGFNV
jgi:uncharacterized protein (TIGR04255 family)